MLVQKNKVMMDYISMGLDISWDMQPLDYIQKLCGKKEKKKQQQQQKTLNLERRNTKEAEENCRKAEFEEAFFLFLLNLRCRKAEGKKKKKLLSCL